MIADLGLLALVLFLTLWIVCIQMKLDGMCFRIWELENPNEAAKRRQRKHSDIAEKYHNDPATFGGVDAWAPVERNQVPDNSDLPGYEQPYRKDP